MLGSITIFQANANYRTLSMNFGHLFENMTEYDMSRKERVWGKFLICGNC